MHVFHGKTHYFDKAIFNSLVKLQEDSRYVPYLPTLLSIPILVSSFAPHFLGYPIIQGYSRILEWNYCTIFQVSEIASDTIWSMGIPGSSNGGTVPYKAISCGDIPLHRPYRGLFSMVGTSNQSVPEMAIDSSTIMNYELIQIMLFNHHYPLVI